MAILLSDNFNTDTSASYTKSGTWTHDNTNKSLNNSANATNFAVKDVSTSDNVSARCSIYVTTAPSNNTEYVGLEIVGNNTAVGNRGFGVCFRGGDTSNIWLLDSSLAWVTSGAFTWTTGVKYWLRIYRNGTNVKCRAWADGVEEPSTWQIDTTVTGRTDTFAGFLSSSGGAASVARYDDLLVYDGITDPTLSTGQAIWFM